MGTKFGKTEAGTIWLDPTKTSPYAFYQFWMNTADADVYRFLRYFTFLSIEEIAAIEREDSETQGRPQGQAILAREVTKLVHGEEGLLAAERITQALFSGDTSTLAESDYQQLSLDGLPSSYLDKNDFSDKPLTMLLSEVGMAPSGKQVKDALQRNAVIVNGKPHGLEDNMNAVDVFARSAALFDRFFLVKLGKKKHHLFVL